ncbi:polysaccharide biosynthesis/export family protein [Novosphingobium resinovorum]
MLLGVDAPLARKLEGLDAPETFGPTFGAGRPYGSVIGPGDALQITLYEAPPAVLFASSAPLTSAAATAGGQRGMALPDIEVDAEGRIMVPFAGLIDVSGSTPQQVAAKIVARLRARRISRRLWSACAVLRRRLQWSAKCDQASACR